MASAVLWLLALGTLVAAVVVPFAVRLLIDAPPQGMKEQTDGFQFPGSDGERESGGINQMSETAACENCGATAERGLGFCWRCGGSLESRR